MVPFDSWIMLAPVLLVLSAGAQLWLWLRQRQARERLRSQGVIPTEAGSDPRHRILMWIVIGIVLMLAIGLSVLRELGWDIRDMAVLAAAFGVAAVFLASLALIRGWQPMDSVVMRAMELDKQGRTEAAIRALKDALATAPAPDRWAALGAILFNEQRWDESAGAFEQAIAGAAQMPLHCIYLALSLLKCDRAAEALPMLQQARQRMPTESALAIMSAIVLADLGRLDEAVEHRRQGDELLVAVTAQQVDSSTIRSLSKMADDAIGARTQRAFPLDEA